MADQRTLVVVGTGTVTGSPDQCVVHISLNGIGTTPAETLEICSRAAQGAITAAIGAGVDRADVRTVNLSVQDYFDKTQQKVTARIGSYQLQVVVRSLDDVARTLAALSEASGDALQIRSLQLGLKDVESMRTAARLDAVRDAQGKARDLAEAAGLRLGEILVLEDNDRSGTQRVRAMAGARNVEASMPVEPGQVSVSTSVMITYAIAD
jgi:uncharacterized protein YggE